MLTGNITGLGAFAALLARVNSIKSIDLRPLADRIGRIIEQDNAAGLAAGTDANGNPMAPFAPSTLRRRAGAPGATTSLVNGFSVSVDLGADGGLTLHARYADGLGARYFSQGTARQPARTLDGLRPETWQKIQDELTNFARAVAAGR